MWTLADGRRYARWMDPHSTTSRRPSVSPAPLALSATAWDDYALLDSGGGRKLERFGEVTVVRPEPQCLWRPARPQDWEAADAVFEGAEDEEAGRWRLSRAVPETWTLGWREVRFGARLTAFRHLGVFPEQAVNWAWLDERLRGAPAGARVLNLFGYTGIASLAASAAGARVTHVDASRKAVGWARDNAALVGEAAASVRWICEDARAYVRREVRRGSRYEGIILDPPKYGRGPAGEVWRLYEDLPDLLAGCAALLCEDAQFLVLNAYSERLSGLAMANLMADTLAGRGGRIAWGELTLVETAGGGGGARGMGLSFFARWSRD
jgi:23S rRNA (cytosine1962-C5)-methyltransferase